MFAVEAGEELGVVGQMKVDCAFENEGADQIFFPASQEDVRPAGKGGGFVDGTLDGGGVECFTVAYRSVF